MVSRLCECLNVLKCFAFILFYFNNWEEDFCDWKDNGDSIILYSTNLNNFQNIIKFDLDWSLILKRNSL